jgi:hypothetical protein
LPFPFIIAAAFRFSFALPFSFAFPYTALGSLIAFACDRVSGRSSYA